MTILGEVDCESSHKHHTQQKPAKRALEGSGFRFCASGAGSSGFSFQGSGVEFRVSKLSWSRSQALKSEEPLKYNLWVPLTTLGIQHPFGFYLS